MQFAIPMEDCNRLAEYFVVLLVAISFPSNNDLLVVLIFSYDVQLIYLQVQCA
jgi:hypothetical protein